MPGAVRKLDQDQHDRNLHQHAHDRGQHHGRRGAEKGDRDGHGEFEEIRGADHARRRRHLMKNAELFL